MTVPADATVSVVVPARNEAAWIERCLDRILEQQYPHDLMEIVVVDGGSTDETALRARQRLAAQHEVRWSIVSNPDGTTPSNLNVGLEATSGEVVCRVDARSLIPPDYVRASSQILATRPDVAVVGGRQRAVAGSTPIERGIARALNNRVGSGLARYRRGGSSGPSDTVYLGVFRRADLIAVGGWNERFTTNQDFELNRRMAHRGLVWFEAELVVGYIPRSSLRRLWSQYRRFGLWKATYWRQTGDRPQPRQLALLLGVPTFALAALSAMAFGGRRTKCSVAIGAVAAVVAVDAMARDPKAPWGDRLVALLSLGLIGAGWTSGAWQGVLTGRDQARASTR